MPSYSLAANRPCRNTHSCIPSIRGGRRGSVGGEGVITSCVQDQLTNREASTRSNLNSKTHCACQHSASFVLAWAWPSLRSLARPFLTILRNPLCVSPVSYLRPFAFPGVWSWVPFALLFSGLPLFGQGYERHFNKEVMRRIGGGEEGLLRWIRGRVDVADDSEDLKSNWAYNNLRPMTLLADLPHAFLLGSLIATTSRTSIRRGRGGRRSEAEQGGEAGAGGAGGVVRGGGGWQSRAWRGGAARTKEVAASPNSGFV
jgi:hypothetical protein